jgi:LysR family transcriptional regulator, regulator for genes of the gallate degradation pathway
MLIVLNMPIWNLNLRHMRAAAVIGQLGSISAAARAVAISQPAITQGLSKLELLLGQPLFERRVDGMEMTDAGRLFTPRIGAALGFIASPRVTITQMRALIALTDAGSYAGAAAITGLSQPSLHRAVGDLSIALKQVLVERRGKGIALTARGRQAARAFRLARAELEAGLSEVANLLGRETGRIAVGAMPLSRARILPAAVAAFYRKYPDVKIEIIEGAFHELIEPLRDGEIDLMIGALRDPELDLDLASHPLFDDRPLVLGRSGHPAIGGDGNIGRLAQYPWIMPSRGTPLRSQWEAMFKSAGLPVPSVPIECGSVITIRQIMLDSDFLTLLSPDQVAVELEAGWLAKIADIPVGFTRNIGITTRKGWRPTAMQAAFLKILEMAATQP